MKKVYKKPVIAVEKLLIENLMQDGHSFNRPQSKEFGGWDDDHDVITDGEGSNNGYTSSNLWDD